MLDISSGSPPTAAFPQEYMDAMQTTLLNGCLPGGASDKDHEWQDQIIALYLKALAELIATVLNPMTSDDDWPSWTEELSFLSDVGFWIQQIYRSLAEEVEVWNQGRQMRDIVGFTDSIEHSLMPQELLLNFHGNLLEMPW